MPSQADDQGTADFQPKNILVQVDFSPLASKAPACAQTLVERFGVVVHLVHITEPVPIIAGIDAVPVPINDAARLSDLERDFAELAKQLPPGAAGRVIVRQGWAVDGIISVAIAGSASREIIRVAEDRKADLIAIGIHGKAGPGRFLLGSTAERVVRHAHCPVLVIRDRER